MLSLLILLLGIATLLNRINKPRVTVAVDGSLYRYHPHFDAMMREKIRQLIKPGLEVFANFNIQILHKMKTLTTYYCLLLHVFNCCVIAI